jgi:hypothetical protein
MQFRSAFGGWSLVAICFLVLSVSFAARAVLGLSMPYLERDLHWTRSFMSGSLEENRRRPWTRPARVLFQ